MAKITISLMRELEQKVSSGEISYSRMVEILNEQHQIDTAKPVQYYKVRPENIQYKGLRFFRFQPDHGYVIQVCLETNNETKRGKGHYIGIYKISRVTFFSNYFPNSIIESTPSEFNEAVDLAISILSINPQPKQ
jgi:transcriptional regulator CtsR